MNAEIIETRELYCSLCQHKCESYKTTDISWNCFSCPSGSFDEWDCEEKEMGLGDVVEKFAKPIAKTIDSITAFLPQKYRTDVVNCGKCKERKEKLNKITI